MNNKVLTIVVPSYNTEKFIDKNIPTFLDLNILSDLELLIINDGSRDDTEKLAKKYEEKYPYTVRVVSKENGGHGSVINKGIEIAQGKYFKVVDGDDWVDTDNLCNFIMYLKSANADLIINSYYFVYEGTNNRKLITFDAPIYGENIFFDDIADRYQKLPIHSITFKTSLLKENGIRVREKCFYEDNEYDLFPIPYVKTVMFLNYPIYYYLIAQKNQSVSDKNSLKNHQMFYLVIKDCIECYENNKGCISKNKKIYMVNTILEIVRSQYNIYLRSGFVKNSYKWLKDFNTDLQNKYPFFYEEVSKKYTYIRIIQSENHFIFYVCSILIKLYKMFTMG